MNNKLLRNILTAVGICSGVASVSAFPLGDNDANWVLGQTDFTTGYVDVNSDPLFGAEPTSNSTMFLPYDVAYDAGRDRLYVADMHNHRVLMFNLATGIPVGKTATNVLGQRNFTLGGADPLDPFGNLNGTNGNVPGCSSAINACGMQRVYSVAYDSNNSRLFVADPDNHRVMVFSVDTVTNGMAASFVLGQSAFTTQVRNQGCGGGAASTVNACGLNFPSNVEYDTANNRLYVVDQGNNRVVMYEMGSGITNGMAASKVFGQTALTRSSSNARCDGSIGAGTTNACGLNSPTSVSIDDTNKRLFVGDTGNHRIMVYSTVNPITNGAAAQNVLGQPNFTTNTANTECGGGTSGDTNTNACGIGSFEVMASYHPSQRLVVSDVANHRLLFYDVNIIDDGEAATIVMGKPNFTSGYDPNDDDFGGGTTRSRMVLPDGVAFDSSRDRMFVADGANHRVLIYGSNIDGEPILITGATNTASTVLNENGTTTVTMTDSRNDTYSVTFPAGTGPLTGLTMSIQISNVTGFDRPRIKISAALPEGTTKSVTIPTGDVEFVCAVDKFSANHSITSCGTGFVHPLPAAGTCSDVSARGELGDNPNDPDDAFGVHTIEICLNPAGTFVTLNGLLHTELATADLSGRLFDQDGVLGPPGEGTEAAEEGGCQTAPGSALAFGLVLLSLALLRARRQRIRA